MRIEKISPKKEKRPIDEGFITDAIDNYIDKVIFPKNLVFRKVTLMESKFKKEYEDITKLIIQGNKSINELIGKSEVLNNRCNSLLYRLRMEFSNNER